MNKKGFISTTLIYTFFILFLLLMLFLLNSYSRIRFLLEEYRYDIKNSFAEESGGDINLYFMVWDSRSGEYEIKNEMPPFGYAYEPEFSYCKNGSTISYINNSIFITATKKDYCYAYFKEIEKDIKLNIYTKETISSDRVLVKTVPNETYDLTSAKCTNGATIEFDKTYRKFKIVSTERTECEAEFTRKDMDIVLNIYAESSSGNHIHEIGGTPRKFDLIDDIPGATYDFHSYVCENGSVVTEDSETGELLFTSSNKDVCDIYYVGGNDKVEIIIMQETDTGVNGYTTGKKYSRVYSSPSTGYYYIGYKCDKQNATITYSGGIFYGTSTEQTTCHVYFNKYDSSKAIINYYLEKTDGTYESVNSVPELGYVFSHGNCQNNSNFTVYNNYVEVNATSNDEVCNFYFKQINSDIKVLVYVLNRETQKYELGDIPIIGYEMFSSGCTNGAAIEYKNNSQLEVTSEGPTVCTVYFR